MTTDRNPATLSSLETRTPEQCIAVAKQLIVLRDLAYANNNRKAYIEAFVGLRGIDQHHITVAEQQIKAEHAADLAREIA